MFCQKLLQNRFGKSGLQILLECDLDCKSSAIFVNNTADGL